MVIHGAGGGVGALAVQLAISAGARVIEPGRAEARELVLHLGAEQYFDLAHDALGEVKSVEPNREQLTELARRIESLRPVAGNVGSLPDGPRRWAEKVAGGIPGKVVLTSLSPAVG